MSSPQPWHFTLIESQDPSPNQGRPSTEPGLQELRRMLRAKRRALPEDSQRSHSMAVLRCFTDSGHLLRCSSIALYLANDGELDLTPIAKAGREMGKRIYLPALRRVPKRALWFCEYRPGDKLIRNQFGIDEPDFRKRTPVPPWGIDLILLPLVGFDNECNRIGRGGGFYDRTLAFKRLRHHWHRPALIGVAHECQRTKPITSRCWDIPLDAVVSEAGFFQRLQCGCR